MTGPRGGTVHVAADFGSGEAAVPVPGDLLLASDPGIAVDAGNVTLPGASVAAPAAVPGPAPR
jgi:hypothetical protein